MSARPESNQNMVSKEKINKPWSPQTDRFGSTRHCSSLEGSRNSSRQVTHQPVITNRMETKREEVYNTYYAPPKPEETTGVSSRVETDYGFSARKPKEQTKKYNIKGLIRF